MMMTVVRESQTKRRHSLLEVFERALTTMPVVVDKRTSFQIVHSLPHGVHASNDGLTNVVKSGLLSIKNKTKPKER
jgi:hypothetical protein